MTDRSLLCQFPVLFELRLSGKDSIIAAIPILHKLSKVSENSLHNSTVTRLQQMVIFLLFLYVLTNSHRSDLQILWKIVLQQNTTTQFQVHLNPL